MERKERVKQMEINLKKQEKIIFSEIISSKYVKNNFS
jgi:hypothetical protein